MPGKSEQILYEPIKMHISLPWIMNRTYIIFFKMSLGLLKLEALLLSKIIWMQLYVKENDQISIF